MTFRGLDALRRFMPDYAARGWDLAHALIISEECDEEKRRSPDMGDGEVLHVVEQRWRESKGG